MGIFSKLIGGLASGQDPKEVLKKAADELLNTSGARPEAPAPEPSAPAEPGIPAEENQYNSGLSYEDYFRKVFSEEFPACELRFSKVPGKSAYVSTRVSFHSAEREVLVVELKSERNENNALRRECERLGVPYLRFYYDHSGWWNTRSYVADRVRRVLG